MSGEAIRFSVVVLIAVIIATFPFWYPAVTRTENKLLGEEEKSSFTLRGVLKEVGEYYIVVTTSKGDIEVSVRGWYGDHKIKWFDVLNNLKSYTGYEVVVEVENEGDELIATEIQIPAAGVKY